MAARDRTASPKDLLPGDAPPLRLPALATFFVVLGLLLVAIYAPVLDAGFADWDDDLNFVDNPHWRSLDGQALAWMFGSAHAGHWTPLTWLSFSIEYAVVGMSPASFHRTNLALHFLASLAVFLLARRLFGVVPALRRHPGRSRDVAALLATTFFAFHPLRVESVAWITERRDLLSTALLVAAVERWLTAVVAGAPKARRRALVVATLLHLASGLAKAWALVLPAVLLVVDLLVLARRRGPERSPWRRLLQEKTGFIAVALLVGFAAVWAQGKSAGTLRTLETHGLFARLVQAGFGLGWYPLKTILPSGLAALHEIPPSFPAGPGPLLRALAGVLGVVGPAVLSVRRAPAFSATLFCYAILVSPVLGLVQAGPQLVADRYGYLSTVPFMVLGAAAWVIAAARLRSATVQRCLAVALIALVVTFGFLSRRLAATWSSPLALWERATTVHPDGALALHNLGHARATLAERSPVPAERAALLARSEDAYRRSLAVTRLPSSLIGLGVVIEKRSVLAAPDVRARELEFAANIIDEGIARAELDGAVDPQWIVNRGVVRWHRGQRDSAIADFEQSLAEDPDDRTTRRLLVQMLHEDGRGREARRHLDRALADAPGDADLWAWCGMTCELEANPAAAIAAYRRSVALRAPSESALIANLRARIDLLSKPSSR